LSASPTCAIGFDAGDCCVGGETACPLAVDASDEQDAASRANADNVTTDRFMWPTL
jgi:hypothetical protein